MQPHTKSYSPINFQPFLVFKKRKKRIAWFAWKKVFSHDFSTACSKNGSSHQAERQKSDLSVIIVHIYFFHGWTIQYVNVSIDIPVQLFLNPLQLFLTSLHVVIIRPCGREDSTNSECCSKMTTLLHHPNVSTTPQLWHSFFADWQTSPCGCLIKMREIRVLAESVYQVHTVHHQV